MIKMRDEYNQCINFRDDALPITNFSYRINKSSKLATMRITRNNQPLNLKVASTADKLGIPPLPQLIAFELPSAEKKRKRKARVLHEVFVKENIVVDGMHRNLSLPKGVVRKVVLAIKEPKTRIFLYNGNFDLFF
ncbi:hypothetical protein Tco_1440399 [Tanacetum coccineum]